MKANQADHPLTTMASLLGVSTSGYYAWLARPECARARRDRELTAIIEDVHGDSRATYGVPRVHGELRLRGERIGRKRVSRLMRRAGLQGVTRRRKHHTTRRNPAEAAALDLLERDFSADGPDRSRWSCRGDDRHPSRVPAQRHSPLARRYVRCCVAVPHPVVTRMIAARLSPVVLPP
jgi:transposase InsO family protein